MMKTSTLLTDEFIYTKIFVIRNQKVMMDSDLADLYRVDTRRLNEQVKRNPERFPEDFMFQLTDEEMEYAQDTPGRFRPARRKKKAAVCFYRTRCFNAFERVDQRPGRCR